MLGALSVVHFVPVSISEFLAVSTISCVRISMSGSRSFKNLVLIVELRHELLVEGFTSGRRGEERNDDQVQDTKGEQSNKDPVVVVPVRGLDGKVRGHNLNLHFLTLL